MRTRSRPTVIGEESLKFNIHIHLNTTVIYRRLTCKMKGGRWGNTTSHFPTKARTSCYTSARSKTPPGGLRTEESAAPATGWAGGASRVGQVRLSLLESVKKRKMKKIKLPKRNVATPLWRRPGVCKILEICKQVTVFFHWNETSPLPVRICATRLCSSQRLLSSSGSPGE